MNTITFTDQQIKDAFCDVDLPEEGYNNQGFYMGSEQRMRYVLVTMELGPYEKTLFTEVDGFLFTPENRNILVTIVGFYFGQAVKSR